MLVCTLPLGCWDFPQSESLLSCRIFPTQSPTKFPTPLLGFFPLEGIASLMGFPLFGSNCELKLFYWDFPHSEAKNLQYCWWGSYTHTEIMLQAYQNILMRIKHSGVKDPHPEEAWSIPNRPMVKQIRQDLHNHFHSQRSIHIFIPSIPFRIHSFKYIFDYI